MQIHFVCLKTVMRKDIWIIWGGKKNTQDQSQLVSLTFAESQSQIKICTYAKFAIAELRRCEVWDALHYIYKWTWIIHAHVSQGLLSICVKAPREVSESSGKVTTSRFHAYRFLIKGAKQKTPSGRKWCALTSHFHIPTGHYWPCSIGIVDISTIKRCGIKFARKFVGFFNLYLYTKTKAATWHYHKHKCHLMKPTDIIYPSSKTYKGHSIKLPAIKPKELFFILGCSETASHDLHLLQKEQVRIGWRILLDAVRSSAQSKMATPSQQ